VIGVRVAVENDVATVQWEQSRSAILRSKANEVAFAFPCQTKDIEKYDGRSYSWIKSGRIVYRRTKKKRTLSYQYIYVQPLPGATKLWTCRASCLLLTPVPQRETRKSSAPNKMFNDDEEPIAPPSNAGKMHRAIKCVTWGSIQRPIDCWCITR
jgi:hypothetical protein